MTWHPIEQHHLHDAMRRWLRPASTSPIWTPRAASRVQGLGVQLQVVDAANSRVVTGLPGPAAAQATPPFPEPHSGGGVAPPAAVDRAVTPDPVRSAAPKLH